MTASAAPPDPTERFELGRIEGLDEPVQRAFRRALSRGTVLRDRVRLTMAGRIKIGPWLAFTAVQDFSGHAFAWRARAGIGPFKPVQVVDRYADGAGSTNGRLLGRFSFMHADDANTARSAAGRAAVESIWMLPSTLLPDLGVSWHAEADDIIVATFDVSPERPAVTMRIGKDGGVRSVSVMRWGDRRSDKRFGYIPFGAEITRTAASGRSSCQVACRSDGGSARHASPVLRDHHPPRRMARRGPDLIDARI